MKTVDFTQTTNLQKIDYLISNYQTVKKDGAWLIGQAYFDPKDIDPAANELNFSLESPGLQDKKRKIMVDQLEIALQKPSWAEEIKPSPPLFINKTIDNNVLVSFRIDDITFQAGQKQILTNALNLARKYHVTFDLGVIARPFDENADPQTFKIYQDNQDVFEIVAHGYDHNHYQNNPDCGEFNCSPTPYRKEHLEKMKEIFEKHHLTAATKVFTLPWNTGINETILLAEKLGYKLMTQAEIPYNLYEYDSGGIIVSRVTPTVAIKENLTNDYIQSFKEGFYNFIKDKQTKIQIMTHPVNYQNIFDMDRVINEIVNNDLYRSNIKFGFISERFKNN